MNKSSEYENALDSDSVYVDYLCCEDSFCVDTLDYYDSGDEYDEEEYEDYEESYSRSYSYSNNTQQQSNDYPNYKETSKCIDGEVVYEGRSGYYVVETSSGYTIIEVYSGYLYEGDIVRGELNSYNWHYLITHGTRRESKVYIEDYMLSKNRAIKWMGEHNKLKNSDQQDYDNDLL